MRCIDADRFKAQLNTLAFMETPSGDDGIIRETLKAALEILDEQPTINTGIVRCRECALREGNECRLLVERDPNTDHRIWSGFFCAYGERRTDDAEIH